MNRALRAATVGVLLLTPVALSACSAGQVNQTVSQIRDKTGPSAQIGDLALREVMLAYPDEGSYGTGDDAELRMSIANSGPDDDALVGISGDGFSSIEVSTPATSSATSSASGSASGSSSGSATASAATGSASQTAGNSVGGASANPTAASGSSSGAATTTTPGGSSASSSSLNIPVPAHSSLFLGEPDAPTVFLTGLTGSLTPAQSLRLTFTFRNAGAVTLDVVVSGPTAAATRTSTFDFSQEPSPAVGGNG